MLIFIVLRKMGIFSSLKTAAISFRAEISNDQATFDWAQVMTLIVELLHYLIKNFCTGKKVHASII